MRILSILLFLLICAPLAEARRDDVGFARCHGPANVMIRHQQCSGTCYGVNLIVGSDGNCHGVDGQVTGQNGEPGCIGTTIVVDGDGNCHGGDGVAGASGGNGGAGCSQGALNLILFGDENCQGGDGGTPP